MQSNLKNDLSSSPPGLASWACDQHSHTGFQAQKGPELGVECSAILKVCRGKTVP